MAEEEILLEIQKQLGRVESSIGSVKEDIVELKSRDNEAKEDLDKAYAKAKARQDSIRDDLQHQIDGNKTLILTVNESIGALNKNIDKMMKSFSDGINEQIARMDDKFSKMLEGIDGRVKVLETKKERELVKWWDLIVGKVIWAFIIGGAIVLFKWLNVPAEVVRHIGG